MILPFPRSPEVKFVCRDVHKTDYIFRDEIFDMQMCKHRQLLLFELQELMIHLINWIQFLPMYNKSLSLWIKEESILFAGASIL